MGGVDKRIQHCEWSIRHHNACEVYVMAQDHGAVLNKVRCEGSINLYHTMKQTWTNLGLSLKGNTLMCKQQLSLGGGIMPDYFQTFVSHYLGQQATLFGLINKQMPLRTRGIAGEGRRSPWCSFKGPQEFLKLDNQTAFWKQN